MILKKKYLPCDCCFLHEDRISDKYRESFKSLKKRHKAEVDTAGTNGRPDDFVDSNSTHILAMAWTIDWEDEKDAQQDNEFWGFPKAWGKSGYTVTALYGSASLDTADSQPVSAAVLLEMLKEYLDRNIWIPRGRNQTTCLTLSSALA